LTSTEFYAPIFQGSDDIPQPRYIDPQITGAMAQWHGLGVFLSPWMGIMEKKKEWIEAMTMGNKL